mmetsp:Transcript_8901/g.39196  ORF Transcript_8901/g.39196 Transcript_8901/m.39196 type:complete len:229 (+) Transcript_8901:252-938(+)
MATNESSFPRRRTRISPPAARTPRCAPPSSARTPRARCWSGGSRGTRPPGSTPSRRSPRAPDPWTPPPSPTASSRATRDGIGRTAGTASSPAARSRRKPRGASLRRSTRSAGTGRGRSWRRCGPPRTPRRGRRCPGSTTCSAARRRRGSSPTPCARTPAWTTSTSTAGTASTGVTRLGATRAPLAPPLQLAATTFHLPTFRLPRRFSSPRRDRGSAGRASTRTLASPS